MGQSLINSKWDQVIRREEKGMSKSKENKTRQEPLLHDYVMVETCVG